MISVAATVRIFVCVSPADMRCSFDRLAEMCERVVRQNPLSGHLFVFRSRRGDRIKILYWDRDGYALWYKRLECGTFRFPAMTDGVSREISAAELLLVLEGIEVKELRRQKRFALPA